MSEAVYVHSLSPYAIHFGGNWGIRWYGLAYVLGLFLGVLVLRRLARSGRFVLPEDRVTDFLTYGFIFGVFLGGRLGYFLFYDGIGTLLSDPLAFFKTLGGGMSSHGGILGLVAFTFYYALAAQGIVAWSGRWARDRCTHRPLSREDGEFCKRRTLRKNRPRGLPHRDGLPFIHP